MVDTIEGFFQQLVDQQPQPLLSKVRGTVRFHLLDPQLGDDHWLVAIDHGDVSASHAEGSADCVIRADKAFFERLVQGRENAIAAMLRIPVGTVKWRVSEARKRVRARLAALGYVDA